MQGAALPGEPDENLAGLNRRPKIDRFDITDADACQQALSKARPDVVFHLAAISSVGRSFSAGNLTFKVNLLGTFNILEAVRDRTWLKKLILVSSSDVYGPVKARQLPLTPKAPFNPISPYAASKAAAEIMANSYFRQYDMPIVTARSFNHTGPRQDSNFVIAAFCKKITDAEKSRTNRSIKVGNLSARRDISDVRDIVRGYRLLAEKGRFGQVYHLCSGKTYVIGDLLKKLMALSDINIRVQKDKELYRKADIPVLQGSFAVTRREIGWKPHINIDTTLLDTLAFWRDKN